VVTAVVSRRTRAVTVAFSVLTRLRSAIRSSRSLNPWASSTTVITLGGGVS